MKTKKTVIIAAAVALSMVLSFLESLIPPLSTVPGVKIGLANIVVVFVLYRLGALEAGLVSLVRVLLSSLLFGSFVSLLYSAFGAVLSYLIMVLAKRFLPFSSLGVSVLGALMHNAGQVLCACIIMESAALAVYFIPLSVSGTVSGIAVGVLAGIVTKRLSRIIKW